MIDYLPPEELNYNERLLQLYPDKVKEISNVVLLTFQLTEDCCLCCTYCYQTKKSTNSMTFEIAKEFIDQLLSNQYSEITTENTFAICVDFIGGEPFLKVDLMDQICNYFILEMARLHHPWLPYLRFSVCSNGILYFEPEVQNFLKKYNAFLSLSLSIDGNKMLHDTCRIDFSGNGSYDRVMQALYHYRENYYTYPGTKMTLAPSNIKYTFDALVNLINEGFTIIHLNCIYEHRWTIEEARVLYFELKKLADFLLNNNLYNKVNISMFSETKYVSLPETEITNYCGGASSRNISIDYKGDFFRCIRYMNSSLNGAQKPLVIGNVSHGLLKTEDELLNNQLTSDITRRSQSTDECFYCPVASGCGWCSAYNYQIYGTVNKRSTNICNTHRAQSLANYYFWNSLYRKLNLDNFLTCNLPYNQAIELIGEEEAKFLYSLF